MKKGLLLVLLAVIGVLAWYFLVTKRKPKEERQMQKEYRKEQREKKKEQKEADKKHDEAISAEAQPADKPKQN